MDKSDFSWIDAPEPDVRVAAPTPTNPLMRHGESGREDGKDRVWACDGTHIWFRRRAANPATLARHNRFVADGDYEYVRTDDDVELYKLREQSRFAIKQKKTINLDEMDFYNVQRLAAKAVCKGEYQTFLDIMTYIRDKLNQNVGEHTPLKWTQTWADMVYGDIYEHVIEMIQRRNGPSPPQINMELARLRSKSGAAKGRVITVG